MFRHAVLLLLAGFITLNLSAQYFGGTPSSISWRQINTNDFRIIFPEGIDSTANHIASVIYRTKPKSATTIGVMTRKVPIILRTTGLESNGYVGLAPFRSEFYLTPPATPVSLGSMPWTDLLAIHEYRHALQYSNFNVGGSRVLRTLFGDEGQILANAASVPDWFFEGDAVYTETQLGEKGRDHIPSFYNGFRALWQSGRNYHFMKLRNGSYRDFVPDKYILGYMFVAYGREKYGDEFWKNVTHDAASFKPLIFPFQSNIRKYSGEKFRDFTAHSIQRFKDKFNDQPDGQKQFDYFTNEQSPAFDSSGALVYLKSSVKEIPQFIIHKDGKEKRIRVADVMSDSYFTMRNGRIFYSSVNPDIRWGYLSYNDIQVLDIASGRQSALTHKTRYFSPAPDEDGSRIVAVNVPVNQQPSLHLLDGHSGKLIKEFKHPEVAHYYHPFIYSNQIFCAVSDKAGLMSILSFDIPTGDSRFLLPFQNSIISYPTIRKDTLYFSSTLLLNDVLFAFSMSDEKLFAVDAPTPALSKYRPAFSADSIAWVTQTAQGLHIQKTPIAQLTYTPLPIKIEPSPLNNQGDEQQSPGTFKDTIFQTTKYRRLSHPFNFHSLEPGINDPEYSLQLIGENILGTLQSQLGISYNNSDRSKSGSLSFNYGGLFPLFSASYSYSLDRYFIKDAKQIFYNESGPEVGITLPLNFSKGRSFTGLTVGTYISHKTLTAQKAFKSEFSGLTYSYLSHSVSLYNQSRQALAQVLPRWGQSVALRYYHSITGVSGQQVVTVARLLFPGLSRTHSFNLRAAFSAKDTLREISYASSFPFARGFNAVNLHRMYGLQFNYQIPLLYPETGIPNIVYWLRLRANAFFDLTRVNYFDNSSHMIHRNFRSAGIELNFDTRWWNQAFISFGLRYTRLMDPDIFESSRKDRFEVILPVNIFNR
ncbi:MAG: hypothetical protein H3C36_09420 [Chitinophagaceae bacterium]|nr:hypothetical protein [Chitinophagaceae bacterium]MCW5915565.1 hypothetical protein [Chitinophagaceae bacterium]MCZ2397523.1 hypothetical protein [Chitinophagales bacterium]